MIEKTTPNIDLREYWQIFLRRKFFFIIPFVLSLIVGIALVFIIDPIYQSSTVVRVSQGQLLSRAMQQLVPGVTAQERLSNLRRLITSHSYLKRLIETLNLYTDPRMLAKTEKKKDEYPGLSMKEINEILWIEQLKRFLIIRQLGTDFIQISAYGNTPEMALNFAKTLTQIFIDESLRNEVGGIRGALEFGSEQLSIYKKKLEDSEDQLRKFQEAVVRDRIDNYSVISSNLEQVNLMLTTTDFELREAKDRLTFLNSRIYKSNMRYELANTRLINSLKAQLLEATLELSKLMLKYSWEDTKILKVNLQIEDLRENIRKEIESEIKSNASLGNGTNVDIIVQKEVASIDVSFLKRKKEALSNLVRVYKTSMSKGPSREMAIRRLQRDVDGNREIYQSLMQQTRGSEIEEALQRTAAEFKFKVIEPAIKPVKPIEPDPIKLILMALAVGSGIGAGLIFFLEYSDKSFKKVEDIEKYLNLPVLGTMSKIKVDATHKFKKQSLKL